MIKIDIAIKLITSTANSYDHIILFEHTVAPTGTNQVKTVLDVNDWHFHVLIFDNLSDSLIKSVVSSCSEWNWCFLKKMVTLAI